MPLEHRPAYWTHDDWTHGIGHLYYFAPANRAPGPYRRQIKVTAMVDVADDGTLAGVELIDRMPPPPTGESVDGIDVPAADRATSLSASGTSPGLSPDPDARGERAPWELKCWPPFFTEVVAGTKRHELRRNDRAFAVGDHVLLREYKPEANEYTGREQLVRITYITSAASVCAFSPAALSPDYCILSIKLAAAPSPVAGMETTAEERASWYDQSGHERYWLHRLLRDHDRLTAEVDRLTEPVAGMETTAEMRKMMVRSPHRYAPINRVLRDFDRQSAEIARQDEQIDKMDGMITKGQAEIARLTAELAEAREPGDRYRLVVEKAREEEREACAKIADAVADNEEYRSVHDERGDINIYALRMAVWGTAKLKIAAAIRARSTEDEMPEQAKPPYPREWDDPK